MRGTLHKLYARTEYAHPVAGCRPALPVAQLQRRYEALLPIKELPGERTYCIRLGSSWESFLLHGRDAAAWYRQRLAGGDSGFVGTIADIRGLVELVMEAWPE